MNIEQIEKAVLAHESSLTAPIVGATDTLPNIRGRIKSIYTNYAAGRNAEKVRPDWLRKMLQQFRLYAALDSRYIFDIKDFDSLTVAVYSLPGKPPGCSKRKKHYEPTDSVQAMVIPTKTQIQKARTKNGGWTKKQLAQWGIGWPPAKGWKKRLESLSTET